MERMEYNCDADLELCPVCEDAVSGYHYGLLTCESCKGFFKRTVQNNKRYICAENQDCKIDKPQRKRCPFCRFQKCLNVGMRLEAVRADRMRGGRNKFGPMYKHDRALKQQKKALLQINDFKLEASPVVISSTRTPYSSTNSSPGLHQIHHGIFQHIPLLYESNYHSTALNSAPNDKPDLTEMTPSSPPCPVVSCAISKQSHSGSFSPLEAEVPQLVMEFLRCDLDDLQVGNKINAHLRQEQEGLVVQERPTNFGLMCLMVDQVLFYIVEWARGSVFFKELTTFFSSMHPVACLGRGSQVSDQMKLLHNCWCELLVLDIISRQVQHGKLGSLLLVTGQEVELPAVMNNAGPALRNLLQRGLEVVELFQKTLVDRSEIACLKFIILFQTGVGPLENQSFVEGTKEQVTGALTEYTHRAYPGLPDKVDRLLLCLSDLRALSVIAEEYLCSKDICGEVPCNNLLSELLHAKNNLV